MINRLLVLLCAGTLVALAGCSESNRPVFHQTFAVSGKVLGPGGSPLSGGRIELHPENPEIPEARGMVKADGAFVLGTYKVNDGVAAGTYKVTVDPLVYDKAGNLKRNSSLPIAKKYGDPATTDLKIEVTGDTNNITLKLK